MDAEEVTLGLDDAQLRQAVAALRRLGPSFSPRFRAGLLEVADSVAEDSRRIIRAYPSRGGGGRGVRDKLAGSITTRAFGQGTNQGVLIISTGRLLPKQQQALVKAWNLAEYRHPVFGNRRRWAPQEGARYFRQEILERRQPELTRVIERAYDDEIKAVGLQ